MPEIIFMPDEKAKRFVIPEIEITFTCNPKVNKRKLFVVKNSRDIIVPLRGLYDSGTFGYVESFHMLSLDQSNKVIGHRLLSTGGINCTLIDIRVVMATALGVGAVKIIISHNHPSGNTQPSENDKAITRRLMQACKDMDIMLLDHIIVTEDSYYSFMDEGLIN